MAVKDWEALIVSIAIALDTAQIPCVLWGHCLLQVHGVPTIIGSVDFVIPDDHLQAASGVLNALALANDSLLTPCPCPNECSKTAPTRPTPPPSFHTHIYDSSVSVGLYLQRDTLWFLPPLNSTRDYLSSPTTRDLSSASSPFILASDQTFLPPWRPGRASGHFKPRQFPVLVPKAHVLLEAYIRIYARDVGTMIGSFAITMVSYMEMYVDRDGFLDVDQLPDVIKTLYCERRERRQPVQLWTQKLKKTLE
jgi:hypothetical protein